jgi:membrane protein DedA with SNARE-associated domain
MSVEFIKYVQEYGLIVIFGFLFLQEVGAPTPIPNEMVLIVSGYLSYSGMFLMPEIIAVAFFADLLAATILYLFFTLLGNYIFTKKPRWFPISHHRLLKMAQLIEKRSWKGIFIGRLTPFVRGYAAAACGFLHIKRSLYFPTVIFSSLVWALAYISIGYLAGPNWDYFSKEITYLPYFLLAVPTVIFVLFIVNMFRPRKNLDEPDWKP